MPRAILAFVLAGLAPLNAIAASSTSFGSSNANRCYEESLQPGSEQGLHYCTQAIRQDDLMLRDLAATYSNRAIILAANGRYEEALEDLLAPEQGKIYLNRGNLFHRTHRYDEALADYDRALALGNVPMVTALYNRAVILITMKNWDEAKQSLLDAHTINPNSRKVLRKLADMGVSVPAPRQMTGRRNHKHTLTTAQFSSYGDSGLISAKRSSSGLLTLSAPCSRTCV